LIRCDGNTREFRVDRERPLGGIGLDRDHADAVGDLVVQLPRNARTLLRDGRPGTLALLLPEPRRQQPRLPLKGNA